MTNNFIFLELTQITLKLKLWTRDLERLVSQLALQVN